MSKQWMMVGAMVAVLGGGATALSKFGPEVDRVEVGAKAPDFRAIDLATGDSVSFREHYKGAVTLVNIWATWCLPCRVEMPAMERVYRELAPRGFKIAAVSIDEGSPDGRRRGGHEVGELRAPLGARSCCRSLRSRIRSQEPGDSPLRALPSSRQRSVKSAA